MFSGKTTRLISRVNALRPMFERAEIVKWAKDTRYGSAHSIVTHDGLVLGNGVTSMKSLKEIDLSGNSQVLFAVDEGQFFEKDELPDLWERIQARNVNRAEDQMDVLLVAGLDRDFRKQRFGSILDLADQARHNPRVSVEMLHSKCFQCGEPAAYSMRLASLEEQVVVGGADVYQAACEAHHKCPALEP